MRFGCVVLTTGDRPKELRAAVDSVREQRDVEVEIVVVVNSAAAPEDLGVSDVVFVTPGSNLGIPEGRNHGVDALGAAVSLVLFLDDDAVLAAQDALALASARFAADPTLGVITMRIVDPDTGSTERRHVPRLRVGDVSRGSWVTTFLGGASIVRREAFALAGGLPGRFFYAHEETSLAWRLMDLGYRIRYEPRLLVHHPGLPPARHPEYHHLSARNRVLLARQHLPLPLAIIYVASWMGLSLARSASGWRATLAGFVAGCREADVDRRPIRWSTVWQMTLLGRPPLL